MEDWNDGVVVLGGGESMQLHNFANGVSKLLLNYTSVSE